MLKGMLKGMSRDDHSNGSVRGAQQLNDSGSVTDQADLLLSVRCATTRRRLLFCGRYLNKGTHETRRHTDSQTLTLPSLLQNHPRKAHETFCESAHVSPSRDCSLNQLDFHERRDISETLSENQMQSTVSSARPATACTRVISTCHVSVINSEHTSKHFFNGWLTAQAQGLSHDAAPVGTACYRVYRLSSMEKAGAVEASAGLGGSSNGLAYGEVGSLLKGPLVGYCT